jgi:hypothetical protein
MGAAMDVVVKINAEGPSAPSVHYIIARMTA